MAGNAAETRSRLLEAATAEFAERGIAGARTDRIAAAAGCNKALIFHYFTSKDALFDVVFNAAVVEPVCNEPIDAENLAEYAGRVYDSYTANPARARLATWYQLERADTGTLLEAITQNVQEKATAIAEAQKSGQVSSHLASMDLLAVVLHMAMLWSSTGPELEALSDKDTSHRRQVVVAAVAALLAA
ncbi:TetR family transcriptional regulator [Streptomyces sp. NPDC058691]|uniref:TetR family transcriptional regulator n=1 Tax=Streptomyces sp. NPDC058691 TaxID=3346601 RepID=UPI003661FC9C